MDKYWVGSGVWNYVFTSNWSASSGGPTGEAPPTATDNVKFDSNSGDCLITGYTTAEYSTLLHQIMCNDLILDGYTGTLSCTDNVVTTMTVRGNLDLSNPGGALSWNINAGSSLILYIIGSGTKNVNFGTGWLPDRLNLGFLSSTSALTVEMASDIKVPVGVTVHAGVTMNMNNYSIYAGQFYGYRKTGTNAITVFSNSQGSYRVTPSATDMHINFGAGNGYFRGFQTYTGNVNSTLIWITSSSTSTLYFDGSLPASVYTYYGHSIAIESGEYLRLTNINLDFTCSAGSHHLPGGKAVDTIFAPAGFNQVTLRTAFNIGLGNVVEIPSLGTATYPVGTLTSSCSATNRLVVRGSGSTVHCNAYTSVAYIDFYQYVATVAVSGTSLGNCGRNSNITFDASRTLYWKPSVPSGNWNDPANWSLNADGSTSTGVPPLAQDHATITGAHTVHIDARILGKNISIGSSSTELVFDSYPPGWNSANFGNLELGGCTITRPLDGAIKKTACISLCQFAVGETALVSGLADQTDLLTLQTGADAKIQFSGNNFLNDLAFNVFDRTTFMAWGIFVNNDYSGRTCQLSCVSPTDVLTAYGSIRGYLQGVNFPGRFKVHKHFSTDSATAQSVGAIEFVGNQYSSFMWWYEYDDGGTFTLLENNKSGGRLFASGYPQNSFGTIKLNPNTTTGFDQWSVFEVDNLEWDGTAGQSITVDSNEESVTHSSPATFVTTGTSPYYVRHVNLSNNVISGPQSVFLNIQGTLGANITGWAYSATDPESGPPPALNGLFVGLP
jgi:hypothetical protein